MDLARPRAARAGRVLRNELNRSDFAGLRSGLREMIWLPRSEEIPSNAFDRDGACVYHRRSSLFND